jgi:invasion protein IalB
MLARRTFSQALMPILLTALSVPAAAQPQTQTRPRTAPPPAVPAPAQPPPAASPEQDTISGTPTFTTATYGDWVVRCQQQAGARTCEVAQTLYQQGQQNPIALIAITREPLRMIVQLPVNVTIPGHVKIALKQGEPNIDLEFAQCVQAGCFAAAQLTQEALKRLRAHSDPGRIAYKDATQRDVTLVFSLRGFAAAMDALQKG